VTCFFSRCFGGGEDVERTKGNLIMVATAQPKSDVTDLLAELRAVIDRREVLAGQDKSLAERKSQLEHQLLAFHEETGLEKLSGAGMSIGFDTSAMRTKYDPEKWREVLKWALDTGNDYIIQRKLTDSRVIELVKQGVALPTGLSLEPFVKMSVRRT